MNKVITNKYGNEYIFPNEIKYLECFEGMNIGMGVAEKSYMLNINGEVRVEFDTEEERKKAIKVLTNE